MGADDASGVGGGEGAGGSRQPLLKAAQLSGTALAVTTWLWLANLRPGGILDAIIAVGGFALLFPVVWLGRRALDARPTAARAAWAATWVHTAFLTLAGAGLIGATRAALVYTEWRLPLPPELGMAVAVAGSLGGLASVLNLALQGDGAPWAIALTRRVATGALYQWTRNPMVLSTLIGLAGLGIWLQSPFFLAWTVLVSLPFAVFLKYFEERELEIRLGAAYLEYRARTPMLWPRRPRS
jgi:protein-S-isoprenylcysteine O-methyltransferase Ste14